jgi:flagellar capping protein FliD
MTGTAGVFGSAAAAGRLLGLDASTMAVTFGLAGTQAGGLRETFGTMTKAFHPARAAQSGLLAALMAQRGFSSTARILEGPHGFAQAFAAGAFDPGAIVDGLGESLPDVVDSLGASTGLLKSRTDGLQASIDDMNAKVLREQDRLTRFEERLRRTYSNLEVTMGRLNALGDYVSQQLGALNTPRRK